MTLVDTSVWVDHLRSENPSLVSLLELEEVLIHPFVVGEIACGNLRDRRRILRLLRSLPQALRAGDEEAFTLIESRRLHGKGVGWVDVHLIASALLTGCALWTYDTRLEKAARHAGLL